MAPCGWRRSPWSCDSFVAMPDVVKLPNGERATVFAKNSDRPVSDSTPLVCIPASDHAEGSSIDLGYTSIAQVRRSFATVGVPLHFTWGFEMGVNEFGVAVGCLTAIGKHG
eukprot:TRINITY_DN17514_c0_g1_i2.p2 TRINITY_DN17514_c0_g1~~TRINITY_DN17514_c0_g1_i2.p2  ORF type:complete len:121 (+),score=18.05 TRINITY_DN17514_c0_g1_i2:32-364(+)